MALDIIDTLKKFRIPHRSDQSMSMRIGIHTGSVMAGLIGTKYPRYRVFGANVNSVMTLQETSLGKIFTMNYIEF